MAEKTAADVLEDGPATDLGGGGHDCDFVSPPPVDYECPVCLLTLRDPQIVDCCGMKFCLSCLELVRKRNKPCPLCKQPFVFIPEKQLKRRIDDLRVNCPRKKAGCVWCGELRDLKVHQTACPFVTVACSLGCGAMVHRCEQEVHELDHCSKRSVETKFYRLTQQLEQRLAILEARCSEQDREIVHLKEVIKKKEKEQQKMTQDHEEEMAAFKKMLSSEVATLHSKRRSMFTMVENALMKRCFSFNVHLSCGGMWASPPFFISCGGYQLQMTAEANPPMQSTFDLLRKKALFQREGRLPVVLCLHVLPRENDAETLDWPVYVMADVLVLTNSDESGHGKLHTLVEYKELVDDRGSPELFGHNASVIGHVDEVFDCRIVVISLEHSPEPPAILS